MHVPKAERVLRWLAGASEDAAASGMVRPALACFLSQQSAEKALKALIIHLSGDAPQTHAIDTLIRALGDLGGAVPPEIAAAAMSLEQYYLPTRYPDALNYADASLVYQEPQAQMARDAARAVLEWVRREVEAHPTPR